MQKSLQLQNKVQLLILIEVFPLSPTFPALAGLTHANPPLHTHSLTWPWGTEPVLFFVKTLIILPLPFHWCLCKCSGRGWYNGPEEVGAPIEEAVVLWWQVDGQKTALQTDGRGHIQMSLEDNSFSPVDHFEIPDGWHSHAWHTPIPLFREIIVLSPWKLAFLLCF